MDATCNIVITLLISGPGCQGFEAEWMIKGIENSTDIEVPIPYGTVVPIKCTGSNRKLSGPDNITCLENNTFSGLSDIYCSGKYKILYSTTSIIRYYCNIQNIPRIVVT